MSRHSEGPWLLDAPVHGHTNETFHCIDAPGFGFCAFMPLADAQLIAAAPDLLAALRGLRDYGVIDRALLGADLVFQVRAAISKAEGRQP